jgi:hypothetical protein
VRGGQRLLSPIDRYLHKVNGSHSRPGSAHWYYEICGMLALQSVARDAHCFRRMTGPGEAAGARPAVTETGYGVMTQSLQPPIVRIVPAGPKAQPDDNGQSASGATGPHRTPAQVAKDIGLFFAAPFVTLAYVSLFPFIAMAMLAQAWRHRKEPG